MKHGRLSPTLYRPEGNLNFWKNLPEVSSVAKTWPEARLLDLKSSRLCVVTPCCFLSNQGLGDAPSIYLSLLSLPTSYFWRNKGVETGVPGCCVASTQGHLCHFFDLNDLFVSGVRKTQPWEIAHSAGQLCLCLQLLLCTQGRRNTHSLAE